MLRHADVQVLLTVDSHLGHDYLDRLEQAVPGLAEQTHEQILLESHPYLRTVWTWGDGPPAVGGAGRPTSAARGDAVGDELLRAVRVRGHAGRPDGGRVLVGQHRRTRRARSTAHGAAVRHAHNLWQMRDLRDDDVLYTPMPLFWVGGFSFTLIAAMHAGATLVFEEQFEPGATLELIERERVTQVLGWPHMAKALVDHPTLRASATCRRSGAASSPPCCPRTSRPTPRCPRPTRSG